MLESEMQEIARWPRDSTR